MMEPEFVTGRLSVLGALPLHAHSAVTASNPNESPTLLVRADLVVFCMTSDFAG
jgi:hypothetical protein